MIQFLRALHGPQIAAELQSHDTVASESIWNILRDACESDQVIYASLGSERSHDDKITGKILLVENVIEFKLNKKKERIVILHDFKNKAGSLKSFQW